MLYFKFVMQVVRVINKKIVRDQNEIRKSSCWSN